MVGRLVFLTASYDAFCRQAAAVVDRIKCVPRFSADARGPTLVVREPRGVKRRGRFVGGKFKPV